MEFCHEFNPVHRQLIRELASRANILSFRETSAGYQIDFRMEVGYCFRGTEVNTSGLGDPRRVPKTSVIFCLSQTTNLRSWHEDNAGRGQTIIIPRATEKISVRTLVL